ncbi:unnamed protein product [Schistosoma mattheei]|uniref:MYND-type domain-containing protein n=1 Tax=Schistosoma mattheei TaxID=31246 RepID=A0A3P8FB60_9TREM|nr:unnamed protein product [Schistosoma mattheei]
MCYCTLKSSEEILESFRAAISTCKFFVSFSFVAADIEKVKSLLSEDRSLINSYDKGYTALMFAGLSGLLLHLYNFVGNIEVVELLLHYGARINDVNSIGRTASQMAAFVGRYSNLPVFLLMNNEIETCSRSGGNYEKCMLTHWRCIHTILEDLCNKYFTPHLTHEPLSLKLHLLACCIRQAGEYYDKEPKITDIQDRASSPLKQLIRKFLVGTEPYGLPLGQEQFLRQSLTSFPHHQSTLWRHIVQQISPLDLGRMPTAFSVLTKTINGTIIYNARPLELCATCGDGPELGKPGTLKACQQCKITSYCSVSCQRLHWFTHKKFCSVIKSKYLLHN